jgi:hypothetical protein
MIRMTCLLQKSRTQSDILPSAVSAIGRRRGDDEVSVHDTLGGP